MIFSSEPSSVDRSPMDIIVCGAKQHVDAVILTRALTGLDTHWWGGRTIAHLKDDDCPPCQANYAPVWKGFFVGLCQRTGNKGLVMVTAGAYENLAIHAQSERGLFGLRVVVSRVGTRSNSPMRIATYGRADDCKEFPLKAQENMIRRIFAANANKVPA